MIVHALHTALSSLLSKKLRSFLTMLGIIIGVFQIIALIGLGQGVKQDISNQVTELGTNLIFVIPGRVQTEEGGYNPAASIGTSTLTESDLQALRQLPAIQDSSIFSLLAGVPVVGERSYPASFNLAVQPSYFELFSTAELKAGRLFTPEDEAEQRRVVIIDRGPREKLFPILAPADVIGKMVRFGKESYEVVGVVESPQSSGLLAGPSFTSSLLIPYSTAKRDIPNTQVFRIILQVDEAADIKEVTKEVKAKMLELHADTEDFTVFTQDDILKVVNNVLGTVTKAIVGLASISLVVGGIGIMNIMLVAVTERTREIGIRKALGASNVNILTQFLIESIVISLLGGALGVGIATALSVIVHAKAGLSIVIGVGSILTAVAFSVGVGVIFGLAPAIRAARKDPIEALRYE